MEDLVEPHLPEVVVDAEQLGLVDVLVQLRSERSSRLEIVSERLLDDDPRVRGQPCIAELLHHLSEQEWRDLEIEDGRVGIGDRRADPLVGGRVRKSPET